MTGGRSSGSVLGAFHDRVLRFEYAEVTDFSVDGQLVPPNGRHLDWIYDEVHLCDSASLEHIIEFESSVIRIEFRELAISTKMVPKE